MNRLSIIIVIALGLGGMHVAAQQSSAIAKLFASAEHKANVEGDLRGAIEEYKRIVASSGKDRAAAAQALLRMAEAHQRLGEAEAERIYKLLASTYQDQREAAEEARRALSGVTRPATASAKGDRPIWTGPDVDLFGNVSPDGRLVTYVDWRGHRDVRVRDLVANTSRALTPHPSAQQRLPDGDFSAISRDGAQVAFWWGKSLHVTSLRGSGTPTLRAISTGDYLRPFDWSPDSRFIAVLINESQLGILSLEDGTVRRLKSSDWQGINHMVFSPDGRFIAYDLATADQGGSMEIRVIAVDATRDTAVVADGRRNLVMGWSAGGEIVFSSDRSGARSLWALQIENGRARGEPRLAKENVRATVSLGLAPSGTLYVYQTGSPSYVRVMPFDEAQGTVLDSGGPLFEHYIEERGRPTWSADGRRLLFWSCGERNWPCTMFIRDGDAAAREIPHQMWYVASAALSPDGRSVVASGSDLKQRGGAHLIDTTTGATPPFQSGFTEWSRDGRRIRYTEVQGDEMVLFERDAQDEHSQEIFRTRDRDIRWLRVSPDGRFVGYVQQQQNADGRIAHEFKVAPLSGGAPRAIAEIPGFTQFWQWAGDSQSVFILNPVGEGAELWRLPLAGDPRKLAVDARHWTAFQISPDGKRIAFAARAGKPGFEVWALENFLPAMEAAASARSARK